MKFLLPLLLLTHLFLGIANAEPTGLRLRLIAENTTLVPGQPFVVGLHIQHQPGYHSYWRNPGIVGLATNLTWELPAGFTTSALRWPYPERCDMVGHPCHGYTRDVTLLTTITPPPTLTTSEITLQATVSWMCCARSCHPGNQMLTLTLPVASTSTFDPANRQHFLTAQEELPITSEVWKLTEARQEGANLHLNFRSSNDEEPLYFFSTDGRISSDQSQTFLQETSDQNWTLTVAPAQFESSKEKLLSGILQTTNGYYRVIIPYLSS